MMNNERIRELAYVAANLADAEVDSGSEFHPAFCRKFAELIIRECAWVAQNKDDTCMDLKYGRAVAAGKILKHFGVEQ